ncbi:hypothetical protein Bca4012_026679 [Brassica carinata]
MFFLSSLIRASLTQAEALWRLVLRSSSSSVFYYLRIECVCKKELQRQSSFDSSFLLKSSPILSRTSSGEYRD